MIELRHRDRMIDNYRQWMNESATNQPDFLGVDNNEMSVTVLGLPGAGDESLHIDINIVIEFMSR